MQRKHCALLCSSTVRDRSIATVSAITECNRSRTTYTVYHDGPSCVSALALEHYRHSRLETTLIQHQGPLYTAGWCVSATSEPLVIVCACVCASCMCAHVCVCACARARACVVNLASVRTAERTYNCVFLKAQVLSELYIIFFSMFDVECYRSFFLLGVISRPGNRLT